ncbi:MAG: hypothetical protein QOG77_982, partial [Solirubrobacteraceae bacterium]|nr:hypothetical protein [Solirubrobacteraceae bacterium]
MGAREYRSGAPTIRPMRTEDFAEAEEVAYGVLGHHRPAIDEEMRRRRALVRFARYLELDAGGQWVAELEGAIVGAGNAILREGIWGLGLLAVAEQHQAKGIGRHLLDATLTYAEGARGGWIMSSEDPKAMRRYARAGFDLHPCVAAAGIPAGARPEPEVEEVTPAEVAGIARTAGRAVRGAAYDVRDLEMLAARG